MEHDEGGICKINKWHTGIFGLWTLDSGHWTLKLGRWKL